MYTRLSIIKFSVFFQIYMNYSICMQLDIFSSLFTKLRLIQYQIHGMRQNIIYNLKSIIKYNQLLKYFFFKNPSISNRMKKIEELRQAALQEVDVISQKQRFGYFTIPANLAIGDPKFSPKQVQRDQNGRVRTQPRNIYTHPTASGNVKSSYFQLSKSIYDGDLYVDPGKKDRQQQLKINKTFAEKEIFKPLNSISKTLMKSAYEYIEEKPEQKNPKIYRNSEGRVITHEKNITTNSISKVQSEVFKFPKYESSPYDAEHALRLKQANQIKSKVHQQTPFKTVSLPVDTFTKPREVFGNITITKAQSTINASLSQSKSKKLEMNHQQPFRPSNPSKSGHQGFFNPFPQYICTSPKEIQRRKCQQSDKKENFKLCNPAQKTTPTPSISLNKVNLRKYI